jgi:hypothetical protein
MKLHGALGYALPTHFALSGDSERVEVRVGYLSSSFTIGGLPLCVVPLHVGYWVMVAHAAF